MGSSIILDCDPGQDDAFAIAMAVRETRIVGLTTVFGNATIEDTTRNALALLDLLGRADVPVARGAGRPLAGSAPVPSPIHAPGGLGGVAIPDSSRLENELPASEFMARAIEESATPVAVVATGPLTNVALLVESFPGAASKVSRISVMGGSTTVGNITPVAEFNVWADPEAASIVFRSGLPIRICGLNVTRAVDLPPHRERWLAGRGAIGELFAEIGRRRRERLRELLGVTTVSLHDPCAVLALTRPELFEFKSVAADVETKGALTRGMTVYDLRPGPISGKTPLFQPGPDGTVEVAVGVRAGDVLDAVLGAFA